MKYLCLVYAQARALDLIDDAENIHCIESLRASGQLLAGEALQLTHAATTLRTRNGQVSITDGAVSESVEQLVGFYLIDARDLNEALRVAAKIPTARIGSIEVRPVRALSLKKTNLFRDVEIE